MDLTDTPEQTMLADSVGRFLTREHTDEARRRFLALPEGWSRDIWQTFAEMGLLAMAFEEDSGGLGGEETSLGVIAQALGRNLVGTPFYDTALLAGRLVELLGTPAQKERFIAPVLEGRQVLAFAHAEGAGNPVEYARPRTKALRSADGWVVCGAKTIVYNAPSADWIAVTAAIGDTDELGLFMVPAKAPGVSLSPLRTTDEHWAADVAFQDVAVPSDARLGGNACDALAAATDRATAIVCADAVGAMEALLAATTEYLQTRVQFGQPLARF